jgi:predicted Zn-dependent peptidase
MPQPIIRTFANGFRLVMESVPHARSVAIGLTLGQGSRHEVDLENGMTHFAEHLLFKGTGARHWKEIAREINLFGGHFNACTSADWVKLYGSVISRDLVPALRLIGDMFLRSEFPASEVERERSVIIEEIAQYDDIPEDLCYERFTQALMLPHPVGRPVIGTEELVEGFTRDALMEYWQRVLTPARMILTVAGSFDESELVRCCEEEFGRLPAREVTQNGLSPLTGQHLAVALDRDLEQVNFAFGVTGPKRAMPDRFTWAIYDTILGGGMGSRLFDEVREKRGLAYSIGSSINAIHEAGYLMISGSTRPETATTAIELCLAELAKLAEEGPTAGELTTAKQQIERSHLLGMESIGFRAGVNGERELYGLAHETSEEVIRLVNAVTAAQVQEVAARVVGFGQPAVCLVGPLAAATGLEALLPGIEIAE